MKHLPFVVILLLSILLPQGLLCAEGRSDLLERKFAEPGVAESFHPGTAWLPYPRYEDRAGWDRFLGRELKAYWIKKGEKSLGYRWQHIPASTFLSLHTTGDKQEMRKIELANRQAFIDLSMAELAEGKGRFLPDLADGFWYYATSWHWSHSNQTRGELPAAEGERLALGNARSAATIPLSWALLGGAIDKISPLIGQTLRQTVRRIILDPFLDDAQNAQNRWMGLTGGVVNNWNPWCAHGIMTAFLCMEDDPDRLQQALRKSVKVVDSYLRDYAADGACDEGSTYWGQSVPRLVEYLQLMKDASGGRFDVMPDPFIESMGAYVSRAYAGKERATGRDLSANFNDANARSGRSVYLIWRTAEVLRHRELHDMALYCCGSLKTQSFSAPGVISDEFYRVLENIRCYPSLREAVKECNELVSRKGFEAVQEALCAQVPAETWYPQTQQCFLRTPDGWFFAAKGGSNGEHHNHNDVGSFILYVGSVPVFVDAGVGTYTAEHSDKRRYRLWSLRSRYHNVPAPNGFEQQAGTDHAARSVSFRRDGKDWRFSLDLAATYPKEAGCTRWNREFRLRSSEKGSSLEIRDDWELTRRSSPDTLNFLTDGHVYLPGEKLEGRSVKKGEVLIGHDGSLFRVTYSAGLTPSVEERKIKEKTLRGQWGEVIRRLSLSGAPDAPLNGTSKIIISKL